MQRSSLAVLSALSLCVLLLPAAHAQMSSLPQLGAPVPDSLLASAKHQKLCRTGDDHRDPCAAVKIGKVHYTIAWDAQTKNVTYLFTADRALVTDTGLSVGDTCRIIQDSGVADSTMPYMKWLIDPNWQGKDATLTGSDLWYAAIHRDDLDHHFGDIVGFVQSRYIQIRP